ncbi:MAG: type II toxin-antitoxin system VapC family toxin [Nanoarchaeota archaeon]|nr:type II toxin-antitoxin system VapC family toxin [Nanoarchaeota archaeon]
MVERYYLDTCIWMDYFENRSDKFRPLGDWALMLINKIIQEESLFVLSDHLLDEIKKQYNLEKLNKIFGIIPKELIIMVKATKQQAHKAFKIKQELKIPFGDALHAMLAKDNDTILVSRDMHFYELPFISVKKPEELI